MANVQMIQSILAFRADSKSCSLAWTKTESGVAATMLGETLEICMADCTVTNSCQQLSRR